MVWIEEMCMQQWPHYSVKLPHMWLLLVLIYRFVKIIPKICPSHWGINTLQSPTVICCTLNMPFSLSHLPQVEKVSQPESQQCRKCSWYINMLHIHRHKFGQTLHLQKPLQLSVLSHFTSCDTSNGTGWISYMQTACCLWKSQTDWCKFWFDYTNIQGRHF